MIDINFTTDLKFGDTPRCAQIRKKMLREQIISRGIKDLKVLKAIQAIPRHRFVSESLEGSAYDDSPLPIEENQTISQPFIVAYMTEALELSATDRILEVGAGSGYQAAILSEIVKEVFTIEINPNLAIEVARRFKKMGYSNIRLKAGDGYEGWEETAPFDGIIVTAAPDHIPPSLIDQLKMGGKLVIPVGEAEQELIVVSKLESGSIRKESRIPVRFVPMIREIEGNN